MKLTPYVEKIVLNKRLEINLDWCDRVILNPLKTECQPDGRIRHWGIIAEADNIVLRVVTLDDVTKNWIDAHLSSVIATLSIALELLATGH